jgi:hypothetical protein
MAFLCLKKNIFLINELVGSEAKHQSMQAATVNYYYQWHILKPRGKRRAKRRSTVSVKTPNGKEEEVTTGIAHFCGSAT